MTMQDRTAQMREAVQSLFTLEQIESLISIWSMRPPPASDQGKAWEQGARWAWGQAESHADAALNSFRVGGRWVDADDALPPSGRRVMFTWLNSHGKRRTSMGRYVAKHSIAEFDDETDGETNDYDEATDTHYAKEGWHEIAVEAENYFPVTDKVTHWRWLPETPEQEAVRRAMAPDCAEPASVGEVSEPTLDMQALQKELFLSSMKDVFRFTRDEMIQLVGRRFLFEGAPSRSEHRVHAGVEGAQGPEYVDLPRESEYVVVPTQPHVALLASMATCLNHGFGLMNAAEQGQEIYDMHKVYDEVVGKGYYSYSVRSRYTECLAKEHGGEREQGPQSALFNKPKDEQ